MSSILTSSGDSYSSFSKDSSPRTSPKSQPKTPPRTQPKTPPRTPRRSILRILRSPGNVQEIRIPKKPARSPRKTLPGTLPVTPLKSLARYEDRVRDMNLLLSMDCLRGYAIEKVIGQGSFGSIITACRRLNGYSTNDCNYIVKLQLTNKLSGKMNVFKEEVTVLKELNEMTRWNGVRLLEACETDSENIIQKGDISVSGNVIVMDLWDGDITNYKVTLENVHNLLEQLSEGIHTLHLLGYVHWDLFRKNVLYKRNPGTGTDRFSITDFGMTRDVKYPPYSPRYYYNEYYFNVYTEEVLKGELYITPEILQSLRYKGIVDYIIMYSILRDVYPEDVAKQFFIDYLYSYDQLGKGFLSKHIHVSPSFLKKKDRN